MDENPYKAPQEQGANLRRPGAFLRQAKDLSLLLFTAVAVLVALALVSIILDVILTTSIR
jgi:hypothetical protein